LFETGQAEIKVIVKIPDLSYIKEFILVNAHLPVLLRDAIKDSQKKETSKPILEAILEKSHIFALKKDVTNKFTTQGHLVDHERRHRNEKPFQ